MAFDSKHLKHVFNTEKEYSACTFLRTNTLAHIQLPGGRYIHIEAEALAVSYSYVEALIDEGGRTSRTLLMGLATVILINYRF